MLNRYSGSLHKSLKLNKFELLSRTREFIRMSATTMATAAGLVQFGTGQAVEHNDSVEPFTIEVPEAVLRVRLTSPIMGERAPIVEKLRPSPEIAA